MSSLHFFTQLYRSYRSVINSHDASSRKPSQTMPTAINLDEGPHLSLHSVPSLSIPLGVWLPRPPSGEELVNTDPVVASSLLGACC